MKKICLIIMTIALLFTCNTANANIFVNDDGTQLTISWSEVSNTFYYEVDIENLTNPSTATITECVFDPYVIVSGLVYHDIYKITVVSYENGEDDTNEIGETYITFALDDLSGNCVCNCDCPDIPKKVFYGVTVDGWWTWVAINNASNESQAVTINAGNSDAIVIVPSQSTESFLLSDIIENITSEQYPITYETDSSDIGVTVIIGNETSFCSQN